MWKEKLEKDKFSNSESEFSILNLKVGFWNITIVMKYVLE